MYCGGWHGAVRVQIDESVNTTQDDITESMLKDNGMALTWTQRHRLYPRTAQNHAMHTPLALTEFVATGSMVINIFLRINFSVGTKQQGFVDERLHASYTKNFVALTQQRTLDVPVCAQLLTDLFFDISGFMKSPQTDLMAARVLPEAFLTLQGSAEGFLVLRKTPEGKAILLDEFVNQRRLESI